MLDEHYLQTLDLVRFVRVLFGDAHVFLTLGGGDPHGLAPAARDGVERRDETAGPPRVLSFPRLPPGESNRPAVRDDDDPRIGGSVAAYTQVLRHRYTPSSLAKSLRSSRRRRGVR